MIRTLRATITYHVAGGVIADVAGVGYLVSVPLRSLPRVGDEVMLFTHHHIREDSQDLYGFTTLEELALFERLLDVSSIGPKSAMAVLAMASANDVAQAIEAEDTGFFSRIPGLGKKSALKIILELKGKLVSAGNGSSHQQELAEALRSLGYRDDAIAEALRSLPTDITDTQAALTWVLPRIGKNS